MHGQQEYIGSTVSPHIVTHNLTFCYASMIFALAPELPTLYAEEYAANILPIVFF